MYLYGLMLKEQGEDEDSAASGSQVPATQQAALADREQPDLSP